MDAFSLGFIRKCRFFVFFLITLIQSVVNCLSPVDFIVSGHGGHPWPPHGLAPTAVCRVTAIFFFFQYFLIFFAHFIDNDLESLDFIVDGSHWHAGAESHINRIEFGEFAIEKCSVLHHGRNFWLIWIRKVRCLNQWTQFWLILHEESVVFDAVDAFLALSLGFP